MCLAVEDVASFPVGFPQFSLPSPRSAPSSTCPSFLPALHLGRLFTRESSWRACVHDLTAVPVGIPGSAHCPLASKHSRVFRTKYSRTSDSQGQRVLESQTCRNKTFQNPVPVSSLCNGNNTRLFLRGQVTDSNRVTRSHLARIVEINTVFPKAGLSPILFFSVSFSPKTG